VARSFSSVKDAMSLLASRNLILYTKGHPQEQMNKLRRSGLLSKFKEIIVVKKKTVETLRRELNERQLAIKKTIMIGNSIKHDIIPAVANQLVAIWFNHSQNERGNNANLPEDVIEVKEWTTIVQAVKLEKDIL
jgi:FMN phosphatase YigB (HAD superfamily)